MCYESILHPYSAEYQNKQLFDLLEPMSEYVWKRRFSAESGPMAGGVLLNEWIQSLNETAEHWRECDAHPQSAECDGAVTPSLRFAPVSCSTCVLFRSCVTWNRSNMETRSGCCLLVPLFIVN